MVLNQLETDPKRILIERGIIAEMTYLRSCYPSHITKPGNMENPNNVVLHPDVAAKFAAFCKVMADVYLSINNQK